MDESNYLLLIIRDGFIWISGPWIHSNSNERVCFSSDYSTYLLTYLLRTRISKYKTILASWEIPYTYTSIRTGYFWPTFLVRLVLVRQLNRRRSKYSVSSCILAYFTRLSCGNRGMDMLRNRTDKHQRWNTERAISTYICETDRYRYVGTNA